MAESPKTSWITQYSAAQIATGIGTTGTVVYNGFGIPADRFRLMVAQDMNNTKPMSHWLKLTVASPRAAFVGGTARIGMKVLATTTNLYVPSEWRRDHPFLSNFALGVGLAPLYNFPRMLQLGKVSGAAYPDTFRSLFMSKAGLKSYAENTALWGPGEGFRMCVCFGLKDFLMPQLGGDVHPDAVASPITHTARMAAIAGPIVALVETTAAFVTESVSTVQAHLKTQETQAHASGKQFVKQPLSQVLKQVFTVKYSARCWVSLMAKNTGNNTLLFWFMFASDYYVKLKLVRQEDGPA